MTAEEVHSFINRYYPDPVLKTWEPDEYDLKHKYTGTKRRLIKLQKDREANNLKLKFIYDKEVQKKTDVHSIIDELSVLPNQISQLFYNTLIWQIEDDEKLKEEYLKSKDKLKQKYQDYVFSALDFYHAKIKKIHDQSYNNQTNLVQNIKYELQHWSSSIDYTNWFNNLTLPYCQELIIDVSEYSDLKTHHFASPGPVIILQLGTQRLKEIQKAINDIMGGNPTGVETAANWGIGSEFNAILVKDTTRVSFKSFIAGGWNIQRRHIRYRVTKLVNKNEQ